MNYFAMRKAAKESGFSMKALDIKVMTLIFIAFTAICLMMMATYKLMIIRYIIVLAGVMVAIIKRKNLITFINNTVKRRSYNARIRCNRYFDNSEKISRTNI